MTEGGPVRDLLDQDLFDVLEIGFREDSYTELIANVFENDHETALEFLRRSFPDRPPAPGGVKARTRLSALAAGGGKIVPDLLLHCGGDTGPELYVIEAKIEAAEGDRQTERYKDAQEALVARYPGSVARGIGFLTLDGRAPSCDGVYAITYEPLVELLQPESFSDLPWMRVAVGSLKARLASYYRSMRAIENGDVDGRERLADFLKHARGLVTKQDLFYWLTGRVGRRLQMQMEAGVAQGVGTAYPLQTFYLPSWRQGPYPRVCALGDSFYIHLEAQLKGDRVVLMLHYETCPYRSGLGRSPERNEYARYWQKRSEFAHALGEQMAVESAAEGWKRNRVTADAPAGNNRNQLATLEDWFATDRTVTEFETWLATALSGMTPVIDRAHSRL
jgi:hypothetical protein